MNFKKLVQQIANHFGYFITKPDLPDFSKEDIAIMKYVQLYTMTDHTTIKALIDATRYIIKNNLEGCFVGCGVWKGGSVMAIIKTLQQSNISDREIYLFDTFDGMTAPTELDISNTGMKASEKYPAINDYTRVSLDKVKENVFKTNYNKSHIHFIKGKVEDTLAMNLPEKITLLRLDTDWYSSTRVELEYLFPKLIDGGVIIIDDYGAWKGSRKASDEYFEKNNMRIFLDRIHPSGARIGIKQIDRNVRK